MCPIGRNGIIGVARIVSLLLAASLGFTSAYAQTHSPKSRPPQSSVGQTYSETVLYSFRSQENDGQNPTSGLIQDQSGNMYGATINGGPSTGTLIECGTVFELTPDGNGGVTYNSIANYNTFDDCRPNSLSIDGQGNLYATTDIYTGSIFELSQASPGNWSLSNFYPVGNQGPLLVDSAGNVYGTFLNLGANAEGAVFELQSVDDQWLGNILLAFGSPGSIGTYPNGDLIMDKEGNLYGTTSSVVFKLHPTKTGWKETVLHAFQGGPNDGGSPNGELTFGPDGNIYGTVAFGLQPSGQGYGGVFQLTKSGKITWIYTFTGGSDGTDDCPPCGGVVFDQAGNLYGSTNIDGGANSGVFRLSPPSRHQAGPWTFDLIYTFSSDDPANGLAPTPPFVIDNHGNIYGVTYGGGIEVSKGGSGVIFKLTPNPVATNVSITKTAPNPSLAGHIVKVNFTVAQAVAGYNAPTGTVTVTASTGEGCTAPLSLNGKGSCNLMFVTAGTRELTASYSGDTGNLASVSSAVTENTMSLTTTEITKNTPDPAKVGQSVRVNFSVQAKDATRQTKPAGSVTVNASTGESCTASVAENGNGNCQLTFGSAGSRTLTARYAGDDVNEGSVSVAVAETVN